jgi:hypothetical protein
LIARSNPIIEDCEGLLFGNLETTDFGKEEKNIILAKEAASNPRNLFD